MYKISSELLYVFAILLLGFGVNLMSIADCGMSMIVCPAYIISQKYNHLTYGQAEYLVAGFLFVIFCIILRKFRLAYLSSFITGFLYATMADILKFILPIFQVTISSLVIRMICFFLGMMISALAVAMFYETYFYPQIYDFFCKVLSKKYKISLKLFKTCFDCTFLMISLFMSLILFNDFVGIGLGTIIMAICNGALIQFFRTKVLSHFIYIPRFKKLSYYLNNA